MKGPEKTKMQPVSDQTFTDQTGKPIGTAKDFKAQKKRKRPNQFALPKRRK